MEEEILKERERIKKIIDKKIKYIIWKRKRMYLRKGAQIKNKKQLIPLFKKLQEDLIFEINNPNYVKKT